MDRVCSELARTDCTAGMSNPISTATIPNATSTSTSDKPERRLRILHLPIREGKIHPQRGGVIVFKRINPVVECR